MFDEKHYVPDAREYLDRGVEIERPAHPPAGKWVMAASMTAVGDRPIGWRLGPALGGLVVVGATYLIGLRLFRAAWAAAFAALLVALDGLAITMSRIGMLDGIQAAFVALGVLFTVWDRDAPDRRWRWATGLVLGLAVAVKWSSAPVLLAAAVFALVAELAHRERSLREVLRAASRVALPLVVLPVAVYVASYAGWFANVDESESGRERCSGGDCSFTEAVSAWGFEQYDMWALQGRLKTTHPDRSRPLEWLTMSDPVLSYAESCPAGTDPAGCDVAPGKEARIVGVGNPALWWTALPVYAYLAWAALRRRRWAAVVVLAFGAVQVLPWFLSWKPGFAFYLTPVVPFAALAVALAASDAVDRWRWARAAPIVVSVAALLLAAWFYPVWTGMELSPSALDARLWFPDWG
ncbi:MAG TPA: phospholipid carrier-dependent glycosyltransferase [Aquihabitans sp.]|jgi:dolichyl-phosphate-mannose--protein O-mannosyl transferase|nr:phospholipid carrier-dependent glycosyltransferase [Aquihabitans sp.]